MKKARSTSSAPSDKWRVVGPLGSFEWSNAAEARWFKLMADRQQKDREDAALSKWLGRHLRWKDIAVCEEDKLVLKYSPPKPKK